MTDYAMLTVLTSSNLWKIVQVETFSLQMFHNRKRSLYYCFVLLFKLSSQRVINERLCKSALCWLLCYGDMCYWSLCYSLCPSEKQTICNLLITLLWRHVLLITLLLTMSQWKTNYMQFKEYYYKHLWIIYGSYMQLTNNTITNFFLTTCQSISMYFSRSWNIGLTAKCKADLSQKWTTVAWGTIYKSSHID